MNEVHGAALHIKVLTAFHKRVLAGESVSEATLNTCNSVRDQLLALGASEETADFAKDIAFSWIANVLFKFSQEVMQSANVIPFKKGNADES